MNTTTHYEQNKAVCLRKVDEAKETIEVMLIHLIEISRFIAEDFLKTLPDDYLNDSNYQNLILFKNTLEMNVNNLDYLCIHPEDFDVLEYYTILVHNQDTNRDYRLALYEFQDFE